MSKELNLIFKKHQTWVDIVSTFGVSKETAEDITQEMYIKIHKSILKNGTDIMYCKNEINYYYIFKTLNSIFIDLKRKSKNLVMVNIEDCEYSLDSQIDVDFNETYNRVKKAIGELEWWDRFVFENINSGESIAEFSRNSKIPYYTVYNNYIKTKEELKKII